MCSRSMLSVVLLGLAWLAASAALTGQEPPGVSTPPGEAADPGSPPGDDQPPKLHEQTIYIPYDKLREVFEQEGRGVFLPYAKFQELWRAAQAQQPIPRPTVLPVEAFIQQIDSDATIADQVVNVRATLRIEVLGKGWGQVPLRLKDAAIRSAQINGQPARITLDPESGHQLLYHKQADEPEQLELVLEYTRAFTKSPGQSRVSFEAPQAPINRWRVRVPEASMAVQIEPMIAATRPTPEETPETPGDTFDLLAFVGVADRVQLSWNPKAEGASGLEAFATVQAEQQIVIAQGVIRSTVKLDFEISRASLSQLVVAVPADQKVINVFDRNVQRWNVETADGQQLVRVDLFEPVQGHQSILVELEQFHEATDAVHEVSTAVIQAVGVGRQQGIVVARLEEGLQAEAVRRSGLLQLDPSDLPESLRTTTWEFAFRYAAVPYELALRVEKVLPRISVTELVEAELSAQRLTLQWQGRFLIQDAGTFQLRVDLPDDFQVRSIEGRAWGDVPAVAVDSYHRLSAEGNTWLVNLSKRAIGEVGLAVQLERPLDDPNLLTPTGTESTIPIPLPRATASEVEFAQGTVVVGVPESLRVTPTRTDGLRTISFAEVYQKIPSARTDARSAPSVLAYSFAKGTTELVVTAQRRRPQVTVAQQLRAAIESGVVKYEMSLRYDVRFSGVKSLRIDVPSALADDIRNISPGVRKDDVIPPPEDLADGYTAWSLAAETELLGPVEVQLTWEQKVEELSIGGSQQIVIPRLIPRSVDRATGQIVISKSESIDIQVSGEPSGLLPIDPQREVHGGPVTDSAAMAFEFVGDWTLAIKATRYELEDSKLTSIERGLVRIVVLTQGELSVQALYRMRSARQRVEISLPEGATFDAQPLRINGKAVAPERGSATTIFAPLVDQEIDEVFVLELRYNVPGTPAQLDLPMFPVEKDGQLVDDTPTQKVFLCSYLPEKTSLLASRGPWSDEGGGEWLLPRRQPPVQSDEQLIDWVTQQIPTAANAARTFPIGQSQLHIYSTLRPAPAPEGSLRLSTMNRQWFHGWVIVLVAAIGLPLCCRSLRWQLIALLSLTAAMVLMGVFAPQLVRALVTGIFPVAVGILILVWGVGHLVSLRRLTFARTGPAADRTAAGARAAPQEDGPAPSDAAPAGQAPPSADSPADAAAQDEESDSEGGQRHA